MLISANLQKRKTMLRLPYYDYSSFGFYFITICTRLRENFLGKIDDHKMICSDMGEIVTKCWNEIPEYFDDVLLDEFVVMPNHIHGILVRPTLTREEMNAIQQQKNERHEGPGRFGSHLSTIVGSFKAGCTRIINKMKGEMYFGWQRGYYEHIVRNEQSLHKIREYIRLNPSTWESDKNFKC
ncbi:MAG: transposase [Gammaproteobacteria bacterium]|nr:transposase [Gammaproteobacteria bacterium]